VPFALPALGESGVSAAIENNHESQVQASLAAYRREAEGGDLESQQVGDEFVEQARRRAKSMS
jgi:hypothetical protein